MHMYTHAVSYQPQSLITAVIKYVAINEVYHKVDRVQTALLNAQTIDVYMSRNSTNWTLNGVQYLNSALLSRVIHFYGMTPLPYNFTVL